MASSTIATIKGTMLAPGISKNNRMYTPSAIGRMVTRMKERLNNPDGLPVVMRTHHDAGDNSRLIVGRITGVKQENDGRATYEARIYNTTAGRDIAALIDPEAPALRTTSVYGYWVGPTSETRENGKRVEVGEDIAIDALDFTASPGVEQSRIDNVAFESSTMQLGVFESHNGKNICESYDATIEIDEIDDVVDYIGEDYNTAQRKSMAGKGQAMQGGRYPIANKSDLRKAIRAVGRGNGSHDAIRQHIKKRASALGLSNMIPDDWKSTRESVTENQVVVCIQDDDGCEIVRISAANVDYGSIKKAAKQAAKIAVRVIDPDDDDAMDDTEPEPDDMATSGDPGADSPVDAAGIKLPDYESTRKPMSVLEVKVDGKDGLDGLVQALLSLQGKPSDTKSEPVVAQETTEKETAVSESEKTAAPAATGLSEADVTKLSVAIATAVTEAMDKAMAAKAAAKKAKKDKADADGSAAADAKETAPAKAAVAETVTEPALTVADLEKKLTEERAKITAEIREQMIKENGLPTRRGFRHVEENDDNANPTGDELWDKRADVWNQFFPWGQEAAKAAAAPAA